MAGYNDTRAKILKTLLSRPNGTEIQPESHQDFALNMLDYIRSVELISASTLIGIADENTVPVQSNEANAAYIAGVAQGRTITFKNFFNEDGNEITVTTDDDEAKLVVLIWNRQYWSKQEVSANVISQAEKAYFYYALTIRKTYDSYQDMVDDASSPMSNDGKSIKVGEIVSVHNELNPSEDAIYSYELISGNMPYWKIQMRLSALDSRTLDGGRADTVYGGTLSIDCGTAN